MRDDPHLSPVNAMHISVRAAHFLVCTIRLCCVISCNPPIRRRHLVKKKEKNQGGKFTNRSYMRNKREKNYFITSQLDNIKRDERKYPSRICQKKRLLDLILTHTHRHKRNYTVKRKKEREDVVMLKQSFCV